MQSEQVKKEVRYLEQLSKEMDILKHKLSMQNKKVLSLVKQNGLVKASFDFGSKVIKYKHDQSYSGITQDMIKKTITSKYKNIDLNQFIEDVKTYRKKRNSERMEITTKK